MASSTHAAGTSTSPDGSTAVAHPGKQPEPWRFGFSKWALTVEGEGSALTCRRGVRERNEPALPVRRAGRPRAWTRRSARAGAGLPADPEAWRDRILVSG